MYPLIKFFLFQLDAEKAHHLTVSILKTLYKSFVFKWIFSIFKTRLKTEDSVQLMGINFPSRLGLAAGFDKNADFYSEMLGLGFGFVEIGTVTPKPQEGNPKPRLFRLPQDHALINRMGFNNRGISIVQENLQKKTKNQVVGGNIGKNKITPNENAIEDYVYAFNGLYEYVDYLVVNVSSPNTPGLRDLQSVQFMDQLLKTLVEERKQYSEVKPILLKVAPDLNSNDFSALCTCVAQSNIEGMIISNTTIDRSALKTQINEVEAIGAGGLSGAPLTDLSTSLVKTARQILGKEKIIIGSGGIMNAQDAIDKINAGADLIQIYTGFVYGGPGLINEITQAIRYQPIQK
jgi:dihydroorotate dehydrogenase